MHWIGCGELLSDEAILCGMGARLAQRQLKQTQTRVEHAAERRTLERIEAGMQTLPLLRSIPSPQIPNRSSNPAFQFKVAAFSVAALALMFFS